MRHLLVGSLVVGLIASAPLSGQSADTAAMTRARALLQHACDADHGSTWGTSLCGPLLLGHWGRKDVIADRQADDGSLTPVGAWWRGTLGEGQFPSNTAIPLGGTRWSMVVLPLPDDDALATTLLVHEQFHRIQRALGLSVADPGNPHLDDPDARRWMRLEWRALARAVATRGEVSCRHARDALAFRAARQAAVPGSDSSEALLERHEGMAEYTGQHLADLALGGGDDRLVHALAAAESTPSYVRSFAYASGPAYGVLLDRRDPDWRAAIRRGAAPAALLAARLECAAGATPLEVRARTYAGDQIAAEERRRADSLAAIRADYVQRLVRAPVLETPPSNLRFTFDPNTVFPLGAHGTVHPTGSYAGPWGSLEVTAGGALVSPDFQRVRVGLPSDGVSAWTLTPADGWELVKADSGWRVVRR